jgi:hypothetical protein
LNRLPRLIDSRFFGCDYSDCFSVDEFGYFRMTCPVDWSTERALAALGHPPSCCLRHLRDYRATIRNHYINDCIRRGLRWRRRWPFGDPGPPPTTVDEAYERIVGYLRKRGIQIQIHSDDRLAVGSFHAARAYWGPDNQRREVTFQLRKDNSSDKGIDCWLHLSVPWRGSASICFAGKYLDWIAYAAAIEACAWAVSMDWQNKCHYRFGWVERAEVRWRRLNAYLGVDKWEDFVVARHRRAVHETTDDEFHAYLLAAKKASIHG